MKPAVLVALLALLAPLAVDAGEADPAPVTRTDTDATSSCPDAHVMVSRVRPVPAGVAWERVRGHEDLPAVEAAMDQAMAEGRTVDVDMPTDQVRQLMRAIRVANAPQESDGRVALGDRVVHDGATFAFAVLARCADSAP